MLARIAAIASLVSTSAVLATASPMSPNAPQPLGYSASGKGDRLAAMNPSPQVRYGVASLTTTGSVHPSIVMRDKLGRSLYVADVASTTTTVSRDAELAELPVVSKSAPAPRDPAVSVAIVQSGKIPVGCERAVSSLTRSPAANLIGRCLT